MDIFANAVAASMASLSAPAFGPWPWAMPFLPPPFPPNGFKQISNQFLASLVLFFTSDGTEHIARALPSFVLNNAQDKPFPAIDCAHSLKTFTSIPSPRLTTRKFSLLEVASSHMTESCSMALAAASAPARLWNQHSASDDSALPHHDLLTSPPPAMAAVAAASPQTAGMFKEKASSYRGITRRKRRWEAHVWR